jgi:gas vesicle protein
MSAEKSGFGWFLIGLGVGAAVGVLYAPKPGRETRDDLASSAREGSEYVKQRSREAADRVGDLADRSREQLNEYVDKGKEAVDKGRAQWSQYVDRGRQIVGEQVEKANAAVEEGKRAYQGSTSGDDSERISNAVEAGQQAYRTT